jgi:hypothetical protein
MPKKKMIDSVFSSLYNNKSEYILLNGRVIFSGEIIKIHGIWGTKFIFKEHVTRTDNGKQWINCYQLEKGVKCGLRSFYPERIKPIPKKKGKKNVSKN